MRARRESEGSPIGEEDDRVGETETEQRGKLLVAFPIQFNSHTPSSICSGHAISTITDTADVDYSIITYKGHMREVA